MGEKTRYANMLSIYGKDLVFSFLMFVNFIASERRRTWGKKQDNLANMLSIYGKDLRLFNGAFELIH